MDDPARNTYPLFRVDNRVAYEGGLEELDAMLDDGVETDPDSAEGRWLTALVNAIEDYEGRIAAVPLSAGHAEDRSA